MRSLFAHPRPLIGMVHLPPLPGSPRFDGHLDAVVERALRDARTLVQAGFDGLIVENFGDVPYPIGPGPLERGVAMAVVVAAVRQATTLPLGVNVQFNDHQAELVVARYAGADFIRVEAFVDSVMTPARPVDDCAPSLLRLRAGLPGPPVLIAADIHVKESVPIAPFTLEESARNAAAAGAAALIVTGAATGAATPLESVRRVRGCVSVPVWIGSGVTPNSAAAALREAAGAIVGTATKVGALAENPVDLAAATAVVRAARAIETEIGRDAPPD